MLADDRQERPAWGEGTNGQLVRLLPPWNIPEWGAGNQSSSWFVQRGKQFCGWIKEEEEGSWGLCWRSEGVRKWCQPITYVERMIQQVMGCLVNHNTDEPLIPISSDLKVLNKFFQQSRCATLPFPVKKQRVFKLLLFIHKPGFFFYCEWNFIYITGQNYIRGFSNFKHSALSKIAKVDSTNWMPKPFKEIQPRNILKIVSAFKRKKRLEAMIWRGFK